MATLLGGTMTEPTDRPGYERSTARPGAAAETGAGYPAGAGATGTQAGAGYETDPGRRLPGDQPVQVPERQPWNAGIADPVPLGLAAFAMTTMVLSVFNAKIMSAANGESVVLGLAFFYGGLGQLLAGMWEFVKGNTFGALAFSSYGAFWLSFWYLVNHASALKGQPGHYIGLYLIGWTIFTAYMTIASLRTTGAITLVFVLLTLTFLVLAIGEINNSANATRIGGYLGLATAAAAWYTSFAGVTNATFRRTVMPVFPRNV
jgi:succinate-acetate transporter protein